MALKKELLPFLALRLLLVFGVPLGLIVLDVLMIRYTRSCPLIVAASIVTLVVIIYLWFIYTPRMIKDLKYR